MDRSWELVKDSPGHFELYCPHFPPRRGSPRWSGRRIEAPGRVYHEHIRVWCVGGIFPGSLKATFLSSVQNLGTNGGGGAVLVNPLTSSASGNLTRTLCAFSRSDFQTCVFLLELIHQLALDVVGQLFRKRGLSTDPSWLGRLDPEDRSPSQTIFELQYWHRCWRRQTWDHFSSLRSGPCGTGPYPLGGQSWGTWQPFCVQWSNSGRGHLLKVPTYTHTWSQVQVIWADKEGCVLGKAFSAFGKFTARQLSLCMKSTIAEHW